MDYMAAQMDRQIEGAQIAHEDAMIYGRSAAFPSAPDHQCGREYGITIRDYFAAKALQGLCADPNIADATRENLVAECYELADAMLAARVKP